LTLVRHAAGRRAGIQVRKVVGIMMKSTSWTIALSVGLCLSVVDARAAGVFAQYYHGENFDVPAFTQVDATIDFEWGSGSPEGVDDDYFSIRWTGYIVPLYPETYTFTTLSDDGVRLWVNGEKIIDHWTPQAPTERSGTTSLPLQAGQRCGIKLEYFERAGGAVCHLSWESASQAKEVIPASAYAAPWIEGFTGTRIGRPYEVGESIVLCTSVIEPDDTVTFQWRRNGVEIPGATSDTYEIASIDYVHEGEYACVLDGLNDAFGLWTKTTYLHVVDTGMLPASGVVGLGLLAGTSLLAGAHALRRRRRP